MKKNKGATTIVVICVMAVIMTLSMGLFLSASVLMKTSGRTLASEQCRILAVSFSKELEQELCDPEYRYENLEQEAADRISENGTISLWHYVRQNINDGSWPYYEESEGGIHGKDQFKENRNDRRNFGYYADDLLDEEGSAVKRYPRNSGSVNCKDNGRGKGADLYHYRYLSDQ